MKYAFTVTIDSHNTGYNPNKFSVTHMIRKGLDHYSAPNGVTYGVVAQPPEPKPAIIRPLSHAAVSVAEDIKAIGLRMDSHSDRIADCNVSLGSRISDLEARTEANHEDLAESVSKLAARLDAIRVVIGVE